MESVDHFAKAARYSGFAVMSTSGQGGVPTTAQALSHVRSHLVQLSQNGDWNAIEERVESLGAADVALIGFQHRSLITRNAGFHVLVLRDPPRIDVRLESSFVASFGRWLDSLAPLLPKFRLSNEAVDAVTKIMQDASITDPLLSDGIKTVLQFAAGHGMIKSLAVVPATRLSPTDLSTWKSTDLVSEPQLGPFVVDWLWDVDDDTVYESGRSWAERSDLTFFGGSDGLRDALRSVR